MNPRKSFRRRDFIGADIVSCNRGKACEHCGEKIRGKDTTVSVRMFSTRAMFIHYKCKQPFIDALKD
jgi:hypothetical protein